MPGGLSPDRLRIVDRISHAAALLGGFVIFAAGGLIVVSVIARRLLSSSIPGDVELIQAATAIAAFAFLPLGQIHRSTIVVDTFTARLPEVVCRWIDSFWDLLYAVIVMVLAWRLAIGAFDAIRSHTISTVLGIPIGWLMLVGAGLLVLLSAAAVTTMVRLVRSRS
jgi:TRAP-type C4-dicarboxylate transport system permease small subunit